MSAARAKWANERLTAWLRDDSEGEALDLLANIREAVEHFTTCTGQDRTCAGITDECEDTDPQDCTHCATDCEECQWYRAGRDGMYAIRPALDLISELDYLLERREAVA